MNRLAERVAAREGEAYGHAGCRGIAVAVAAGVVLWVLVVLWWVLS